jgi:hypothetical protein
MDQGDTRPGRNLAGTRGEPNRLPSNLLGLRVRITVECMAHGSHSAILTAPFLKAIESVRLMRDVCDAKDRWCVCEYTALDYVPEMEVTDWV